MYKNIVKPVLDRLLALIFVLLFWWLYIILAILSSFRAKNIEIAENKIFIKYINNTVLVGEDVNLNN